MSVSDTTPLVSSASIPSFKPKQGSPNPLWRRRFIWALVCCLLGFIVVGLLPRSLEVDTAVVESAPLAVWVVEGGKTRIRHRHVISAPFAGRLGRVTLRAGDRIESGKTVLMELFPDVPGLLNPRSAREADARWRGAEAGYLRNVESQHRARAALDFALKEKERAETLGRTEAITSKEWDAVMNQVELQERDLRAAEYAVLVAWFDVEQAKAAMLQGEQAGESSAVHRVIAPVEGLVLSVFEENERLVGAGTPVMELGDPMDLEMELELLSSDAVGVKVGAPVSIEHWGGERPLKGSVASVEPSGYTKVSSLGVEEQRVKVHVDFAEPLLPDWGIGDRYRVEARIQTWFASNVLQVPVSALYRRGSDWTVFVLEDGRAHVRVVEIAHGNGVNAEVRSGLSAGQLVIAHAPDGLMDGMAVRPRGRRN